MATKKETIATKKTSSKAPVKKTAAAEKKEIALNEAKGIALKTDLVFEPAVPFEFKTNAPVVLAEIKTVLEKYKKLKITDKNFDEATLVKRKVVSLRTMLTNRKKEAMLKDCDPIKQKIAATFDTLLKEVTGLEETLDKQFAVFDKAAEDELRAILQGYVDELQDKYDLPEEYLGMIEFKKKYFNKGQKEKDTYDDLVAQFDDLKARNEERLGNIVLIESAIKDEPRFNRELLLEQLSYRSITAILQDINKEKERFKDLDAGKVPEKIVVGAPAKVGLLSGKKQKRVRLTVSIECYEDEKASIVESLNSLNADVTIKSSDPA